MKGNAVDWIKNNILTLILIVGIFYAFHAGYFQPKVNVIQEPSPATAAPQQVAPTPSAPLYTDCNSMCRGNSYDSGYAGNSIDDCKAGEFFMSYGYPNQNPILKCCCANLATDDSDGDGFTNEEETSAGTDPNDGSSNPSVSYTCGKDGDSQCSGTCPSTYICAEVEFSTYSTCVCINEATNSVHPLWKPNAAMHNADLFTLLWTCCSMEDGSSKQCVGTSTGGCPWGIQVAGTANSYSDDPTCRSICNPVPAGTYGQDSCESYAYSKGWSGYSAGWKLSDNYADWTDSTCFARATLECNSYQPKKILQSYSFDRNCCVWMCQNAVFTSCCVEEVLFVGGVSGAPVKDKSSTQCFSGSSCPTGWSRIGATYLDAGSCSSACPAEVSCGGRHRYISSCPGVNYYYCGGYFTLVGNLYRPCWFGNYCTPSMSADCYFGDGN